MAIDIWCDWETIEDKLNQDRLVKQEAPSLRQDVDTMFETILTKATPEQYLRLTKIWLQFQDRLKLAKQN